MIPEDINDLVNLLLEHYGDDYISSYEVLQELLFEMNDDDFADKLESTIVDAMATWLPYITVENIDINQSNELKNSNSVEISISFRVGETPTLETVTFNAQV